MSVQTDRLPEAEEEDSSPIKDAALQVLKILLGVACLAVLVMVIVQGEDALHLRGSANRVGSEKETATGIPDVCSVPTQSGLPLQLEMLAGTDVQPWLDLVANRFAQQCPNIHLKLVSSDDMVAARAILSGESQPAIWAPTDDLVLRYAHSSIRQKKVSMDLASKVDLIESPLVLLIWEDRLKLLSYLLRAQPSNEGQWVRGLCALIPREPTETGISTPAMIPGRWADWYRPLLEESEPLRPQNRNIRPAGDGTLPPLASVEQWGHVKIAHPWPTRFAGGLSALYLMSAEYIQSPQRINTEEPSLPGSTAALDAALDSSRSSLHKWLRRCEAGREWPPLSESALTESMFAGGPTHLDGVVTYEHLALPLLERIDGNAQVLSKLMLLYPKPTLVARHPAVILASDPLQKEAAQRWLKFLRSPEMQELAIPLGFRPADHRISVRDFDSSRNRFLRLRRYGVLPSPHLSEAAPPSGRVLAELMEIWGEATGRN